MTLGTPFLYDVQLCSYRYLLEGYGDLKFPWQIRVVEFVCVANVFVRYQFEVPSDERMPMSYGEISEGHLVSAADLGFQVVNLAG